MRAVAQRSAQAAKELKDLFKTSLGHARGGFERIEYAGETLAQLATQTADIDEKAKAFRAGAAGRSATVNAIRENLDRIATMAQSHADTALAVASASDSLDQRIDRLLFLFGRFRFGENQSPEPTSALQLRAPEAESTTWATRARASPRKATDNSASSAA
jgi:methyl-accepting chemotaxis protein